MHAPRLLVLDEPTLGLDPQGRRDLWERIAALRRGGMSVLMTTHALQEAEACSRVGIIDRGSMIAIGSPAEIGHQALGQSDASLEDSFVALTGRQLRDAEASSRDRMVAFRKQGGELTQ
jgi:ABC-2 type transport system ATP-binding protein